MCSSEHRLYNISQIEALPVTAAQIQAATHTDPILRKVMHLNKREWPRQGTKAISPFYDWRLELTVK